MQDLNELGVGVTLYFRLLKYISMGFFIMALVSMPTLYLCATGSRIEQPDSLSLTTLTLGNIGPVPNTPSCNLNVMILVVWV